MILQTLNSPKLFIKKRIFLIWHLRHGRQLASLIPSFPPSHKTFCALSCWHLT